MFRKAKNTGAFRRLAEPMQLRHVENVARKYGIDLHDIHIKIERDECLIGKGIYRVANPKFAGNGRLHLFPDAFQSEEQLARTIYHEKEHLIQFIEHGYENVIANREMYERLTEDLENAYFSSIRRN